ERALDDASFAVELEPRKAVGYVARAWVRVLRKEFVDGLKDCASALALEPSHARAYSLRGEIRKHLNELEGALADLTTAVVWDPQHGWAYYGRGALRLCTAKREEALSDFRLALLSGAARFDSSLRDYAQLQIWMTETLLGRGGKAGETWSRYLESRPRRKGRDWSAQMASFLVGLTGEADLYRSAAHPNSFQSSGRLSQAHFCAGIGRLFRGDRASARQAFDQCLGTGVHCYYEYFLAKAALAELSP